MIDPADKKREQILDKALLRFAHFGINKTTMNDIADDLSLSKPSLYYYFPDKLSLVVAVAERIFEDFFARLEKLLHNSTTVKDALFAAIDLRKEFIEKYFMLHLDDTPADFSLNHEHIQTLLRESRVKENAILSRVFQTAVDKAEIFMEEIGKTTELYMDSMIGLGMCVMRKQKKQLIPERSGFEEAISKQKALTEIFLNGFKR